MKCAVCAMFDRKAGVYGQPIVVASVGVAVRGFTDQVNGVDSTVNKHPEDFDLYQLGWYDDVEGKFYNYENSACLVVTGSSVKHGGV